MMNLNMLFEKFDLLMDFPNSISKIRELILQLAVQGKLVEQASNDEPASELLKRIKAEKKKLISEGKIKKQKPLPPIAEDEIPYGIPEGWAWIRLEEVFYPISVGKKKIKNSEISEEGPCPVIDQGQSYIAGYTNEADKLINIPGPVIIFGDHTCELKLINFDFVAGADGVKVLRPVEIYENYFFLALKTLKMEDRGYSRHYKYFLNNLLPLPSFAEQKRIVSKVDQLMHLCDQLDACQKKASTKYESLNDVALEKLLSSKTIDEFARHWQFLCDNFDLIYNDPAYVNKLRQAILQLAVQGKLSPQDPNDEPASELLKRIKAEKEKLITEGKIKKQKLLPPITEDEIPYELPQGWKWVRLGDICNQITDGTHHTPHYVNQGVPFLSVKDISKGKIDFSNTRFVTKEEHEKLIKRCKPEFENILFTKVGTTGIAKVVDVNVEFSIFVSVALLKFSKDKLYPYFLEYLLNSPLARKQSAESTQGIGNKNLVIRDIARFLIPIPPLTEQKRIVSKVDQLMHLRDELEANLTRSKKDSEMLMQAVLHEAFS